MGLFNSHQRRRRSHGHRHSNNTCSNPQFSDLLPMLNQPLGVHKVRTALFACSLQKLRSLLLTVEAMNVYDPLLPEYRLIAIIMDIGKYRLFKPVRTESINSQQRLFFPLRFVNKGIDMINISNILHNKDVMDKVPPYFTFQDPPIVSYTYSKTIGRKLFNYNRVLKEIDIRNNVHDGTCDCMSSPFCYKPHGHIITGDMKIVPHPKLRQLFQFGPKYREPPKVNWNFNFKLIMDAAEAYAKKWAALEDEDVGCLSDWLRTVRDKELKYKQSGLSKD